MKPIHDFPGRWSVPASEIRARLRDVVVDDFDDDGTPIKRKLDREEISELIAHWRDMVRYAKMHFKSMFHPEFGLEYVRIMPVNDGMTCEGCSMLSNLVFLRSDPRSAAYFPPLHIGCRCTAVLVSKHELERDGLEVAEHFPDLPDLFSVSE